MGKSADENNLICKAPKMDAAEVCVISDVAPVWSELLAVTEALHSPNTARMKPQQRFGSSNEELR